MKKEGEQVKRQKKDRYTAHADRLNEGFIKKISELLFERGKMMEGKTEEGNFPVWYLKFFLQST